MDKAKLIIAQEGVPRFFIRFMINLEDALNSAPTAKADLKKMSSTNAKSLNKMRAQFKKQKPQFEQEMEMLRLVSHPLILY